ncbi:MAG: TRAP transporter small permease subunit, partial [Halomonas sp.]|nr:TRAP transporter small permease subunit [Halomonas sp.]MDX5504484.1 TRAP transporter small permease subunit [Halomonas sp.]
MPSLRQRVLAVSRTLILTLAATLLLINLAAILYGVFMRYLAGGAPIWTDELARFLIIATVMLAAGAVWVEGGHMRVALIERLLPRALARVL